MAPWWTPVRLIAAVFLVVYLGYALPIDLWDQAALAALLVIPLYLASHALRAVRLFLILYDGNLRLREALFAHIHSAGISALIPFKLGEIYRVLVIYAATGQIARAVVAAWIERVFDALLIVVLLCILALYVGPAALSGANWFFPVVAVFLFTSFFMFLVLPEILTLIKRHLILKHNNTSALRGLAMFDRLHRVLAEASFIWRSRFATILWLSLGIWTLEVGAVFALVGSLADGPGLAGSATHILTQITLRSSPWSYDQVSDSGSVALLAYRLGTVDILAVLSLGLALTWRGTAAKTTYRSERPELQWA